MEDEELPAQRYERDLVQKLKVLRHELSLQQPQAGHCRIEVSREEIFEVWAPPAGDTPCPRGVRAAAAASAAGQGAGFLRAKARGVRGKSWAHGVLCVAVESRVQKPVPTPPCPHPQSDSSSAPAVSPEPGVPPPPPRLALSPQTRAGASLWFLLQLGGQTGWAERCPLTCAGRASARRAPSQDHARRGTSAVPGPSWGPRQRRSGETG